MTAAIKHMGVDHGGGDIGVAQEFLNGTDIVTAFEQMSGKAVAQSVAVDLFAD